MEERRIYLLICTCVCVGAEVYTSSYQVRRLARAQTDLIVTLKHYIDKQEAQLKDLKM